MNISDKKRLRLEFLEELKSRLIGPGEPDEEVQDPPHKRYLTGMLFPKGANAGSALTDEEQTKEEPGIDEENIDLESPVDMLFQKLPASVGITFALEENETSLVVRVNAAQYLRKPSAILAADPEKKTQKVPGVWKRFPLRENANDEVVVFSGIKDGNTQKTVLDGRASIYLFIRHVRNTRIATVSIVNEKETPDDKAINAEDILFQTSLSCAPGEGIPAYPDPDMISDDMEAKELALQYRSMPVFAVGHGCAVTWPEPEREKVSSVAIDFMPSVEVPPVTTEITTLSDSVRQALSIKRLQDTDYNPVPAFREFISSYKDWSDHLCSLDIPLRFSDPRKRILERIESTIKRMADGVDLLENNPDVMRIFRLANKAMLIGMARNKASRSRDAGNYSDVLIEDVDPDSFLWRPFQLAFILISFRGLWSPEHDDRSIVDLIWFPTGGGKTEAYLAVAAFEMLRRRMLDGSMGEGTAVIKRYTLRLLTIQQFERSGSLICALESMRRNGDIPGKTPFSLGLWVGKTSSPNTYKEAKSDLTKLISNEGDMDGVKIPLKQCPVCATPIVSRKDRSGYMNIGIRDTGTHIELFCPNPHCPFHDSLPISYIDEYLYDHPPTMLLGTVDKFAMLAWRDAARAFFGTDRNVLPPSLVIQDELHLISGPLGTLAGIYEAAIDTAISVLARPAKYICATATIRRADEQILKLYARKAALFPPPGLDASDSFFSRMETEKPGRMYVGAMGQGHTPTFSNVIASTAILASAGIMREHIGNDADTWWTLVAYHNSKRELGKTMSLAHDDIPARLSAIGEQRELSGKGVIELSSNLKDSEIPETLHQLGTSIPDASALDLVACTSMLSVGVDIERLGLMLINGQPKTVSEYIQASSRVGRDSKRLPGLVIALFSPTKPRDRSHYEFFVPFHKAYYRHVEPTSVTPFALPAQDRGLHGAFIVLVRMVSDIHNNKHASMINEKLSVIEQLEKTFMKRVQGSCDGNPQESQACLDNFISFWKEQAKTKVHNLRFQSAGRQHASLIRAFKTQGNGWETLQSLRHVDTPVKLFVPVTELGKKS